MRIPNALGLLILTLTLGACGDLAESQSINQPGIIRVIKEVNQGHNQGVLTMEQLQEHYLALNRYTDGKPLTRGTGAMGAFYTDNLGTLYREFVSLKEGEAFLILHSTVKTGEAYIQESAGFSGDNTLEALKEHQQELLERYRD